tara:strand:- start:5653 stop:7047 length:1395 start_codon:yes stop_codon:yes gene_type:complete
MASTYTTNTGIEKPGSGEQSGTWGTTTNNNFDIIDRAINGVGSITLSGTTTTLTTSDGALSDGGYKVLILGGSPSGTNTITITPNDQSKVYLVFNNTNQIATFTQGNGANANVPAGKSVWIFADGAGSGAIVRAVSTELINDTSPQLSANLDLNSNDITGTGNISLTGNITNTGTATLTTADNLAQLTLVSTDTDANAGPAIKLSRNPSDNTSSDGDLVGQISYVADDAGGGETIFTSITGKIITAAAGAEDGGINFNLRKDGTTREALELGSEEAVFNQDAQDIDFRVEGDTNANLIKTDADNNRVGIGKDPTQGLLDIDGDSYATNYYGNGSNLTGIHTNQALMTTSGTDSANGSTVVLTRTITPTSTSSKILLLGCMTQSVNDSNISIEFKRDSTLLVGSMQRGDGNETIGSGATNAANLNLASFFIDEPNTTSEVSYTMVSDRSIDTSHNSTLIAIEITS